jgi:peptidyl-prolyl cis-trans isomerase NIMA-interacting 1
VLLGEEEEDEDAISRSTLILSMSNKRKDPLPSGWQEKVSSTTGRTYYWNTVTQKPQWERPSAAATAANDGGDNGGAQQQKRNRVTKATASHLLVKHSGSRRPSSWKEKTITRSKDDAIRLLRGYQDEINSAPDKAAKFAQLASVHSDCSSHSAGGDLGEFTAGKMQKAFEDATFALEVGEMSGIVESDSGVHLILRTK